MDARWPGTACPAQLAFICSSRVVGATCGGPTTVVEFPVVFESVQPVPPRDQFALHRAGLGEPSAAVGTAQNSPGAFTLSVRGPGGEIARWSNTATKWSCVTG